MATGKDLKFQFTLDDQSFQKVKRALTELTSEAHKFAKAMNGVAVGGMGGGGAGLFGGDQVGGNPVSRTKPAGFGTTNKSSIASAILGDAEAFKKLALNGKESLNAMTDAVRRGVRDQINEVTRLEAKLASLQDKFNKLPASASELKRSRLLGAMGGAQNRLDSANSDLTDLRNVQKGLGGGGFIQRAEQATGMQFAPQGIQGLAKIGGMIVAGVTAAIGESMGGTREWTTQESRRSGLVNPEIRRLRSGDVTGLMARQDLLRDADRRPDLQAQAGGMGRAEAISNGAKGVVLNPIKTLMGGGGDSMALGGLTDAAINTSMAEQEMAQVRAYENSTAFLDKKMALESFYGNNDTRKSVGRILGVGLNRDKRGIYRDTYSDLDSRMTAAGFSASEYAGAYGHARAAAGGQFAGKNAGAIMAANAAGLGGYGSMLIGANIAGSPLSAATAMGTGKNVAANIALGQGVIGGGFDPRGTTSGLGLLSAAQGPGFNWGGGAGDMATVQRVLAGAQMGSSITQGFDTYQQGRNILNAIGVNPGGSTYAQDYLGTGMSMKQMMDGARGNGTATSRALGLTPEMMRSQLSGSMSSVLDRFVDQGASDPMSKAIRGFRRSGQSIDKYLSGLYKSGNRGAADAIGSYFGMITGEGEEGGLSLAGLLGGVDNKGRTGRGPGIGRGTAEKALDETRAAEIKRNGEVLGTIAKEMVDNMSKVKDATGLYKDFGTNFDKSVENFTQALNNLASAMDAVAYKSSGGAAGNAPPKAEAPNKRIDYGRGPRY